MLEAGSRSEDIAEAAAQLKQAQANYDLLLAGTRSEDLAAAEGRVAEARGRLHEIEANLDEAVVHAPERVLVEVVGVRKGDLIQPNQPILRVLRANDLWVKAYVPEPELGQVRLDQPAEVTVDAYPEKRFQGTVTYIAAESEFTPRNVQSAEERKHQVFAIKVHVPDPQGIFKSGMAAMVSLPLQ
jgi:multidrug resistance efflux pump